MVRSISYLSRYRGLALLPYLFLFIATLAQLLVPRMVRNVIDAVTNGVVWANDTWMLAGRGDDGVFVAQQPIDEQMGDAERRRLLYVACTRAVDHLVVSLHRGAPTKNNAGYDDWGQLTSAELLWAAGAAEPSSGARAAAVGLRPVAQTVTGPHTIDWADHDDWSEERNRVFVIASRRTGIAATRLSEELAGTGAHDEIDDQDSHLLA